MKDQPNQGLERLPADIQARFDAYPGKGRVLTPTLKHTHPKGSRGGYALELYQATGRNPQFASCAYCGLPFLKEPTYWYSLSVDHIVPQNAQEWLRLEDTYIHAMANQVLCCLACNTYANRSNLRELPDYTPPFVWTPDAFFFLRDRAFVYHLEKIRELRNDELATCYRNAWGGYLPHKREEEEKTRHPDETD